MNPLTWSFKKKKIIYNFFFYPYNKNLNTLTLNFLLNPIEISLNMILSFSLCLICIYVFLVFLYVRSSILISALHISKSKKFLLFTPIPREWQRAYLKNHMLQKQNFITRVLFFLISHLLPGPSPTPKCFTILIYLIFFIQLI